MTPERSTGQGSGTAFRQRLEELKERGCAILVVGSVPSDVTARACERLLGETDRRPRHRVLAFTNGRGAIERGIPERCARDDGDTAVITAAATRGAAAATAADVDVPVRELETASLAELGVAVSEAIETFERRHGPLEPGDLRVCLNSLLPLLDEHGDRTVFEFALLTAARVRTAGGIGHFHLPAERDAVVVRQLAPVFDAVIQLRTLDDEPQQRWLIDDEGIRSGWLPL